MTPYITVYDAFLAKMLEDEWVNWSQEEMEQDLYAILEGALPQFKYPRVSLDHNEHGFVEDLGNDEIQIIATYMKCGWLERNILRWENVKPLYEERDFSQANLLDKFIQLLSYTKKEADKLQSKYYRSINYKPFSYSQLAKN